MIFTLAWRNIWRNKRRTAITISAIAFAVFMASFMRAFQKGVWDSVIDGAVNQYFGYAQIHKDGYWEDQSIDNVFAYDQQFEKLVENEALIDDLVPRIESFALASEGSLTSGVLVLGIDPEKEDDMIDIEGKMIQGSFLKNDDMGVVISSGLAEKLNLELNDTLILISQGYHGANAAGKFPIHGIFTFAMPDLNKRLIFMSLPRAQEFYDAHGLITTLAVNISDRRKLPGAISAIYASIRPIEEYEVMEWSELIPELVEARQVDEAGGYIVLGILYLLISFAIFGTVLMMTKERSYEFGVLTAIGLDRMKLFATVWIETILLGIMGAMVGIIISLPIVYYFNVSPLDASVFGDGAAEAYEKFGIPSTLPTAFESGVFLNQALLIFLVTTVLALYPFFKIMRLNPVQSMRH